MQTKTEIQELLTQAGVKPNKRLGQHFLIDLNLMRLIVESADIQSNDVVLEVGCGTGSLTSALLEKAGKVICVEYDKTLAGIAKEQLAKFNNLDLINADILDTKHLLNESVIYALSIARKNLSGRFLLVANLPYNVASPVMTNLVTGHVVADSMFVTVQKEVAERMNAAPGSNDYGTLSIFLGVTGDVKIIRILKPSVFWPQPQVNSAMVTYVRNQEKCGRIANMDLFCRVVHLFMSYRRKTVLSCSRLAVGALAEIDWPEIFRRCSIDPTLRPEHIKPQEYVCIANQIATIGKWVEEWMS
jgi:16S rRNA (adenine1518-N6/adenine1519-N6)-dimethyltransferase